MKQSKTNKAPNIMIDTFNDFSEMNRPRTTVTKVNLPISKRAFERFSFCLFVNFTILVYYPIKLLSMTK